MPESRRGGGEHLFVYLNIDNRRWSAMALNSKIRNFPNP